MAVGVRVGVSVSVGLAVAVGERVVVSLVDVVVVVEGEREVLVSVGVELINSDNGQIVYLPGRVSYAQILCSSTDVACSRLDGALLL